ncbi:hypothetical protein [Brevibacterium senegalense]|uniref:hypothetical protein n=1 Tax=Brevibacterium senegalense TaxID=1033736 RepID=UPI0002D5136B|nr:hypothetical protein [Brevibacterium senegalense]
MPAAGYRRPDRLDATGLVVSVIGTDGQEAGPFDFSQAPAHGRVRQQLIDAFIAAAGPEGRWRSAASMGTAHRTAVAFLRSLDRLGIGIDTLSHFGPEQWWIWRSDREERNRWPGQVNIMRVLLKEIPEVGPLTRRALSQRTHKPRKRLYDSYSVTEFEAIRRRAGELVRACEARISANVAALEHHRDVRHDDGPLVPYEETALSRGALLERRVQDGRLRFGRGAGEAAEQSAVVLGTGGLHPTYALFPSRMELLSLMAALVCDRGYNLSTLESMVVPDLASEPGRDEVLVSHLDKPRRGHRRYFTNSFSGPHARTLRTALTITAPARECLAHQGHPTDRLLIAGTSCGVTDHPTTLFVTGGFTNGGAARRWDKVADLRDDDGQLLHVHFGRLRLSEQVINRKSSQNSAAVSEDIYRRPDALTARLHQDVILDGQAEAAGHARDTVRLRYAPVQYLGLPVGTADAVLSGSLDTAATACLDFNHSPYSADGDPCTASFLMCLACPNAVATPAHLPLLVLLDEALNNLASVDPARFEVRYRKHGDRLGHLLESSTTPAERAGARDQATEADREVIERLLRRDLDA